jgi:hypothetical protein
MAAQTKTGGILGAITLVLTLNGIAEPLLTREQANEEISLIHSKIMDMHPDPFWFYGEEVWAAHLQALTSRTGKVGPIEQYFALASLMALATDTHVQIYPIATTPGFTTSFPIRFRLYEEGVFVTAADDYLRDSVGERVVSVSNVPVETVVQDLSRFASADHPLRKLSWGVEYLMPHPASYEHLGLIHGGVVTLELESRTGERRTTEMVATIDQGFAEVMDSGRATAYYWPDGWRTLDDLIPGDVPMSRARLSDNYWYTDLENGKVVYMQLNRPVNKDDGESLNAFVLRLFQDIDARELTPEKLIIDLRHDLGGQIDLSLPVAYLAGSSKVCCTPSHIVTLIGRETISAGSLLAGALEVSPRSVMIGEPTGGKPNVFIGHIGIQLPYSQFKPEVSRILYTATDTSDQRLYVAPDIPIAESFEQIMTGGDAGLSAALQLTPEEVSGFLPLRDILTPWRRPSQDDAQHTAPEVALR